MIIRWTNNIPPIIRRNWVWRCKKNSEHQDSHGHNCGQYERDANAHWSLYRHVGCSSCVYRKRVNERTVWTEIM